MIIAFNASGQPYTSQPNGFFTVSEVRGCAPFTVTLNAPTCDGSVGCDADYESNGTFESYPAVNSHTYTVPGIYTIRFIRGAQEDNIQIEVFDNVQPTIQIANCGGNRVTLSVLDNSYDQYLIDYDNDGTDDVTITGNSSNQHLYAASGNQTISVRGKNLGAADNCNAVSQSVNVLAALPTPFVSRLQVLSSSEIRFDFTGVPNVHYRVEMAVNGAAAFQQIKTLFNQFTDTIRNIQPDDNVYCFRIGAFNPCNNTTTYSNVICSPNFDLTVLNNENRLIWSTANGPDPVTRHELQITPTNTGTSFIVANATSPYADTNINCGQEYCYQLTMVYANNSQSISMPKCGTAISTDVPAIITNISTLVTETGVTILWITDPAYTPDEFSVFRSGDGNNVLLAKTADQQITDDSYTAEDPSCYKISYGDVCGNESLLSPEVCPIVLTGELTSGNEVVISWTQYDGWENGVAGYVIEKYDADGTIIETIDVGSATTYTDANVDLNNQVYIYVVSAIPNDDGIIESVSNRMIIIKDPNLFYPTSFTPNGDALNDLFNVYGQYISAFQMDIFNRWGELMFTTNDLEEGWDGKFKGTAMPEGTYTFVARITDFAGRTFKKSGSVLLLQKK
jgi:gliding motility-associated-like protein